MAKEKLTYTEIDELHELLKNFDNCSLEDTDLGHMYVFESNKYETVKLSYMPQNCVQNFYSKLGGNVPMSKNNKAEHDIIMKNVDSENVNEVVEVDNEVQGNANEIAEIGNEVQGNANENAIIVNLWGHIISYERGVQVAIIDGIEQNFPVMIDNYRCDLDEDGGLQVQCMGDNAQ